MICHIIWMSPMLKFDLVRSSSVENFEDMLTIFVIFHLLRWVMWNNYIILYRIMSSHYIICYMTGFHAQVWPTEYSFSFGFLKTFWPILSKFKTRNCNLTWWKGTSGHSKLYAPWFADLHTDNILHCNIAIDWIRGLIAKGCSFVTDKEHYRSIKKETILTITVNSL